MSLLIKLKRTVYVIDGSEKKKNPKKERGRGRSILAKKGKRKRYVAVCV